MALVNPPSTTLQYIDTATGKLTPNVGMQFMQKITNALNGTPNGTQGAVAVGVSQVTLGNGINISAGSGSPEGIVPGKIGDIYMDVAGVSGFTLYVKQLDSGTKTGWSGK